MTSKTGYSSTTGLTSAGFSRGGRTGPVVGSHAFAVTVNSGFTRDTVLT